MHSVWFRVGTALTIGLVMAGSLCAADDHKAGHGEAHANKMRVEYLGEDGQPKEEEFDLDKPADFAKVTALLKAGKVHAVEQVQETSLLALSTELGVYTIVVFGLLFWILYKNAWGPMLEGLHKREENILSALNDAKKAREEAHALRTQLQKEMDNAAQKVAAIMEESRRDAQQLKDEMVTAARNEIQTEKDRARREVEMAKDQALQELWQQTVQLASLISVKTIRKNLTPEDHRQLVDEALTEIRSAGPEARRFMTTGMT